MKLLVFNQVKKYIIENDILNKVFFTLLNIIILAFLIWVGLKLIDKGVFKLTQVLKKRDNSILLRFMPLLNKVVKICFVFIFVVLALQLYGFSVSTLVAGIGVGGVVFGLAAQKTIINVFGSVSLIVDNAYKVGDYICINIAIDGKDIEGTVEDITLRSTKIRGLDGTIFNIPNGNISEGVVKNYTQMKKRYLKEYINLTYSVTSEQIEKAKQICIDALNSISEVKEGFSVTVSALNSYSVDLQIVADVEPVNINKLYEIKNDLFTQIYKKFNENGIEFAFPTQTIELKQ